MIFKTAEELERYRASVRELVLNEFEPLADEFDHLGYLPEKVMRRIKEFGLLALRLPQEYGGSGLTLSQYWPIDKEISKTHGSIRMLVHGSNWMWRLIYYYGTEEQKRNYLPRMASGEIRPCFALTEPDAGSGVDIKTTATKQGKNYIVNGRKHLISHADFANPIELVTYTNRALGRNGISVLLVDRNSPGLTITRMPEFMGGRATFHGVLTFKDCAVPAENLLGREGQGLEIAYDGLDEGRFGVATNCLGEAERFLELSVEFAKRRVTFGKPIAQRQFVQGMLAEMATDVYALSSMIADTARKLDAGLSISSEASLCKLFGLEMIGRVSDRALRIHGGIGLTRAYPIERLYRDVRINWFEEGTAEIQKIIIARDLLKEKSSE